MKVGDVIAERFEIEALAAAGGRPMMSAGILVELPIAMVTWRNVIEPRHPTLLGGVFGPAAGTWGWLVVVLFCPWSDPGHVARGHLLLFVVLIGAAALLGKRFFGVQHSLFAAHMPRDDQYEV